MKTVTLPIEEYNELVQDQKDKQRLMRELEADAKERGFFVKKVQHMYEMKIYGCTHYAEIEEKGRLMIISKDDVLADAQKEIDRLSAFSEKLAAKVDKLTKENVRLKCRGFWKRLFNREE